MLCYNATSRHPAQIFIRCGMDSLGTRWRTWFRDCATSREVAGSIPDSVIGIFHWHNPSVRTMALVLTHPLTEMSNRNLSWRVKAAFVCWFSRYSEILTLLEPSGPVQACNGIALPLPLPLPLPSRTGGAIAPEPQINTKQYARCDVIYICHCTKYLYKPDSRSVGTRFECLSGYLHVLAEYFYAFVSLQTYLITRHNRFIPKRLRVIIYD